MLNHFTIVSRSLVEEALRFALAHYSHFTQAVINILVHLVMFCLDDVIIQHKQNFYTQKTGIITVDDHLVTLANIALHDVILPISHILNQSILFKRFIGDIIWLSHNVKTLLKSRTDSLKHFKTISWI